MRDVLTKDVEDEFVGFRGAPVRETPHFWECCLVFFERLIFLLLF